jgi:hypothetical protein
LDREGYRLVSEEVAFEWAEEKEAKRGLDWRIKAFLRPDVRPISPRTIESVGFLFIQHIHSAWLESGIET